VRETFFASGHVMILFGSGLRIDSLSSEISS
jgi:hypothetical protein